MFKITFYSISIFFQFTIKINQFHPKVIENLLHFKNIKKRINIDSDKGFEFVRDWKTIVERIKEDKSINEKKLTRASKR